MREGGAKVLVTLLFIGLLEGGLHIQAVPTSAPRCVKMNEDDLSSQERSLASLAFLPTSL